MIPAPFATLSHCGSYCQVLYEVLWGFGIAHVDVGLGSSVLHEEGQEVHLDGVESSVTGGSAILALGGLSLLGRHRE